MKTFIGILDGNTRQIEVRASRIDYAARKLARKLFRKPVVRGYTEYSPTSAVCYIMPANMGRPGHQVWVTGCSEDV